MIGKGWRRRRLRGLGGCKLCVCVFFKGRERGKEGEREEMNVKTDREGGRERESEL